MLVARPNAIESCCPYCSCRTRRAHSHYMPVDRSCLVQSGLSKQLQAEDFGAPIHNAPRRIFTETRRFDRKLDARFGSANTWRSASGGYRDRTYRTTVSRVTAIATRPRRLRGPTIRPRHGSDGGAGGREQDDHTGNHSRRRGRGRGREFPRMSRALAPCEVRKPDAAHMPTHTASISAAGASTDCREPRLLGWSSTMRRCPSINRPSLSARFSWRGTPSRLTCPA